MKKKKKLTPPPDRCPRCGNKHTWGRINPKDAGSFSVRRASIGILLLGPFSLIGGSMGRRSKIGGRRQYYFCEECGFDMEYLEKREDR